MSSSLSGETLIFDKSIVKDQFELNRPIEMDKESSQKVLSEALLLFGLTKIPTDLKNTSKIVQARDIRFETDLPSYKASKSSTPKLPDNKTAIKVTYQGVKGVDTEILSKKIEPLLSRYGRVMPMRDGSLVLIDLANQLQKIIPEIQKQDFPLTAEEKAKIELEKKREHELELARLKSGDLHEIGPHGKHEHEHEDH